MNVPGLRTLLVLLLALLIAGPGQVLSAQLDCPEHGDSAPADGHRSMSSDQGDRVNQPASGATLECCEGSEAGCPTAGCAALLAPPPPIKAALLRPSTILVDYLAPVPPGSLNSIYRPPRLYS